MKLKWVGAIALVVLLGAAAVLWLRGGGGDDQVIGNGQAVESASNGWVDVGLVPLSERQRSALLTDGDHVYVIGGASLADSATRGTPMKDGAVLDLATGEWRSLPPLPMLLDEPSAMVAGDQIVVGGRSCRDFVADTELDGCKDPGSTYLALDLEDLENGWTNLPEPGGVDGPTAVGAIDGTALFQRPSLNGLDLIYRDGSTRSLGTPVGMLRGVVCTSPLGALALDAAGRAWTLDLDALTWSPPRSAPNLGTQRDARVAMCASQGGILGDSQGMNAVHFDQRTDEWVQASDVPVPLGFPLAAATGTTTHVMGSDPVQARTWYLTFDADHSTWMQPDLPTNLTKLSPEQLRAGNGTAVLFTPEGTDQRLWVNRSAEGA